MVMKLAVAFVGLSVAAAAQDSRGPQGPGGTVTISRPDYDRMMDLAARDTASRRCTAGCRRADAHRDPGAGRGGIVRATMQVDGEVFRTGSIKVPLIAGATLIEARMAAALPLIADGTTHVAVSRVRPRFSAMLEWGAAITFRPGRGSFALPVPPAARTATFDVPGEQTDVRVSPGLVLRRSSANGRTIVEATLDPGSTEVWWSMRDTAPSAAPRDARAAGRRHDARHDRRLRPADGHARRPHRRAGRAAESRSACRPATRSPRERRIARAQRGTARQRRGDRTNPRSGGTSS